MGLDMNLERELYFSGIDDGFVEKGGALGGVAIKSISGTAIYWCKANAIHKWFVDNVQNGEDECQRSWVGVERLKELHDIICQVLNDHDKASELLPTSTGFFFGSTDYDEYYFNELEQTKKNLEKLFQTDSGHSFDYYYQSSW